MAGIADLLNAEPAYYGQYFRVVSGTNWEIEAYAKDGDGNPVPWANCTAVATLRRSNGTVVKTITQNLEGGTQIDLSTAGRIVLRATPQLTFASDDLLRPLVFNLLIAYTVPEFNILNLVGGTRLVLPAFQRCFIVAQPNLN